jgi:glycosyltransferase involved in cell wall biosynthesis
MTTEANRQDPAITVLTPVYNGEQYLAECIESVRAQTRTDWEYVIVDNCSTDGSVAIAAHYAGLDSRIRVVRCSEFVNAHRSFSRSIGFMSPGSRYCKFVCADDLLYPECLERMVEVAERHPTVGLVSAHRMYGQHVNEDKPMPVTRNFTAGREALRRATLEGIHGTGSPTTVLYRADVVRNNVPFFDETMYHSDTDAALRTMQQADYGFVHQTLTFSRLHADTITASFADRANTYLPMFAGLLIRYGWQVLTAGEYRRAMRLRLRQYAWFLVKARLRAAYRRDKAFQSFHAGEIRRMQAELSSQDRGTRVILKFMQALLAGHGDAATPREAA